MSKDIKVPDDKKGLKYTLVSPFVEINIKWEPKENEFMYLVSEPKLTKEDEKIREKIVNGLLEILDIELSSIKKRSEALDYLRKQVKKILDEYDIKLPESRLSKIIYYIYRDFVGLNDIEPMMQDPNIEDISCDGIGVPLFIIHRKYGSIKSNVVFKDEKRLKDFVVKLAERSGRFVSYAEPLLDGTLPGGSRVQATFSGDVTTRGPSFTIRKFVPEPYSPVDLMNKKTVTPEILAYLWLAVENGASILISGGAGTGKTTLLNVMLMFVPSQAKIISIEDTRELNIPHENWVPSVTRVGFAKGYGEVTMFDLLKESFRQTPDYVVVGEVRGKEAYVMFQGMASGIPAIGTMHAGRVEDVIYRLETPPINLSPSLIDTLDMIIVMIHAREKGESARRVKEIVEIEAVVQETGKARTNAVYRWAPKEDKYSFKGVSWYLQQLAVQKGLETSDLLKELDRRKQLLEFIQKKGISNYKKVVSLISEYRKNPAEVIEKIKSEAEKL
ncbi:MAG: type II/IV secretion system ATPase subunit [Candidatus Aenigmatarchaeota archaeon]